MENIIAVELILYFVLVFGVGYYFSRRKMTHSDFLLGGKQLPGWALAFSERATGESSWLLLGFTGFVFVNGLSSIWVISGMGLGIIVSWLFLAKKFMEERDKYDVLTLPDYLATRFPSHGKLIRYFVTILILVFFTFYLGAQIAGAGKTLLTTFNLNPIIGLLLCTAAVIVLAFLGGFVSVVWTDMIQSMMMLLTLTILPILAFIQIYTNDISLTAALDNAGNGVNSWTGGLTGFAFGALFFNNFTWFFGYLGGQPQLSSRFMALKNPKEVKVASITGIVWMVLAFLGAFLIGITAIALYNSGEFTDVETILPTMILDLTPPWISGILLAGILAAIITTADSQIMVVTSSVTEDIMNKSLKMKLSDKKWIFVSRIVIIASGMLGLIIALMSKSLVYAVVSWAWTGVGATLSPAILLTFFWKRYSGVGALATVASGLICTLIWINSPLEEILSSRFTTFFIASLFGIVFSLIYPDKAEKSIHHEKQVIES
ncbi:MAG TPA: sodium/proline symporter [Bacillus bacterium]|uniref:sodium/proline symporter n=1 Tax=Siminovitchia fordii TaxID=254759 RepID=UPI000375DDF8|nr:sodium/proline symporter [Siminovitchia fordii]HBZ10963.1 sodium/proline symporter [Bacillus sp. (in: firmicutes)]